MGFTLHYVEGVKLDGVHVVFVTSVIVGTSDGAGLQESSSVRLIGYSKS